MARVSLIFTFLLFFAGLTIALPLQKKADTAVKPAAANGKIKQTVRSGKYPSMSSSYKSGSDSGSGSGSSSDSGSSSGSGSDSESSDSGSDSSNSKSDS